jgi:hypothetical protein
MKKVLLLLLCLGLATWPAWASVSPNSIVTAQTPSRGILQFLPASTPGTYGTLYTAGANGSRCNALWVDNNDLSQTHIITCQLVNTAIKYGGFSLTTVSPAALTTFNQATLMPSTSILGTDSDGNPFIQLNSGDTLQCTYATAVTASAQVDIHAHCADF